jgi:hypothetical protein
MKQGWSRTEIAALVDGSIEDEAQAERLRRIVEIDPDAAAFASSIERSNQLLRGAFDAPMQESTPASIEAAIGLTPASSMTRQLWCRVPAWASTAAAASLALVIGIALGVRYAPHGDGRVGALGELAADAPIARALETLRSGETSKDGVQPTLTFHDSDGAVCREFEVVGELPSDLEMGVACRGDDGRWNVLTLTAGSNAEPTSQDYVPASGPAKNALDATLDAIGAGPPMSPQQELKLIRQGWAD